MSRLPSMTAAGVLTVVALCTTAGNAVAEGTQASGDANFSGAAAGTPASLNAGAAGSAHGSASPSGDVGAHAGFES